MTNIYGRRSSWRHVPLIIEHSQIPVARRVYFVYVIEHRGRVTYVGQTYQPVHRALSHRRRERWGEPVTPHLRRGGRLRVIIICENQAYAKEMERRRIAWGFAHGEALENCPKPPGKSRFPFNTVIAA